MSGFLSRWSQRKLAEKEAPPEPEAPPPPETAATPAPAPEAPPAPLADAPLAEAPPSPAEAEPEFDLASLPPLDTLHAGSDFTLFLRKGVPEGLRQAALRRAWVADPLIRDHVSPLDYAWDFNSPGGLPGGFAHTLGEVGERLEALIRQAVGERPPEEPGPAGTEPTDPAPEDPPLLVAEAPPPESAAEPEPVPEEPPEPQPTRRHGGALPV
ncbi:DUF3306 domain-containing protein [Roseococcus sp. DSY-14]|uniref:DUF3306 domain-containing protein n=1 Tax=Roseococcus sp. DSY-14 TaxID=3369650 RepID=UPI00387B0AF4